MSMGLKPCECGNEDLKTSIAMSFIGPHILVVRCEKCLRTIGGPSIWVEDTWNTREPGPTPGPATKKMLEYHKKALDELQEMEPDLDFGWLGNAYLIDVKAFLDEHGVSLEPRTPRMPQDRSEDILV